MKKKFKRLSDHQRIDLIPYLKEKIVGDVKVYVGADSQNVGSHTVYATVVVLHWANRGGHVLYTKEILPRIYDQFARLWGEVEKSLELAVFLKENGINQVDYIDLDLNPDPKYHSNTVLRAALGYVESLGFKARIKPDACAATCCADSVLH